MTRLLAVSPTGLASGAEAVLLRVFDAAQAAGWDVACASPPGPLVERLGGAGIEHVPLPDLKLPAGHIAVAAGLLGRRTVVGAAHIRRAAASADVILINGFFALPAVRLSFLRAPCVWLVHDVIHRRSWLRLLKVTHQPVSLAIAVSEAVGRPLRRLGMDVRVVRNGTPWPVSPRADERASPFVVGCAALLTSWKGQDVLLDAVARLGRPDVRVELAGGHFPKDGPFVRQLQERAARPDLRGTVAFLGPVSDALDRMRSWTIAVSSSVQPEAGPLAPLEAMSLGVPVIGTDHGGTPEVLGDAGLLVPPADADAMAGALARLLDDEELWTSCHRAGPAQIKNGLTLDVQMERIMSLLDEVARRTLTR